MKSNFEAALAHILKWEGGFSDDPNDPGGATSHGITKKTLEAYRGKKTTKEEVKNITMKEVKDIYRKLYWVACRCDYLPLGIDIAIFDCAVNQGVNRAIRFLQKALGVVVDGDIGPQTMMTSKAADGRKLLIDFFTYRSLHYSSLGHFSFYGRGWTRRLFDTHHLCVEVIGRK